MFSQTKNPLNFFKFSQTTWTDNIANYLSV